MVRRGKFNEPLSKLPLEIVLYLPFNSSVIDSSSWGLRTPNLADTAAKSVPL